MGAHHWQRNLPNVYIHSLGSIFSLSLQVCVHLSVLTVLVIEIEANRRPPRGYCTQITSAIHESSRCYSHLIGDRVDSLETSKHNAKNYHIEELVYVRLETVGSKLDELATRPINDRVLVGVFDRLLGRVEDDPLFRDVKMQISGSNSGATNLADKCRAAIERLLCRMLFPSCHFRRADISALVRPPCREDCLLVRDVLCSNLNWNKFSLAFSRALNITLMSQINALDLESQGDPVGLSSVRQQLQQKQTSAGYNLSSSIHFYWPHEHSIQKCESLPPLRPDYAFLDKQSTEASTTNNSDYQNSIERGNSGPKGHNHHNKWPSCSDSRLTRAFGAHSPSPISADDCLESKEGVNYQGTRNYTKNRLACQFWTDQSPHKHSSSELLFDNMKKARNYCRNPGGVELKPWCYTLDSKVRWEYCDINRC